LESNQLTGTLSESFGDWSQITISHVLKTSSHPPFPPRFRTGDSLRRRFSLTTISLGLWQMIFVTLSTNLLTSWSLTVYPKLIVPAVHSVDDPSTKEKIPSYSTQLVLGLTKDFW